MENMHVYQRHDEEAWYISSTKHDDRPMLLDGAHQEMWLNFFINGINNGRADLPPLIFDEKMRAEIIDFYFEEEDNDHEAGNDHEEEGNDHEEEGNDHEEEGNEEEEKK
jgi:hypothetical protein